MRNSRKSTPAALTGLLLAAFALPAAVPVGAGEPLFRLSDPRGDDDGDGSLVYPIDADFEKGDLDLVELAAYREGEGTLFRATFARPIRAPERRAVDSTGQQLTAVARHGFYTFNLDLYIDQDRTPGSGDIATLPGRKVEIAPEDAWEKIVVLAPMPFESVEELERHMVEGFQERKLEQHESVDREQVRQRRAQIEEELASLVFFPNQIRVAGPSVEFFVPDWFLGGPARADWGYVVLVTGARLDRRVSLPLVSRWQEGTPEGLVMPVERGRPTDAFGGALAGEEEIKPPVVDMLVPSGRDQRQILGSYDPVANRPAQVPAVVPLDPARAAPPDR